MAAPIVQMWYVKSPGSDILTAPNLLEKPRHVVLVDVVRGQLVPFANLEDEEEIFLPRQAVDLLDRSTPFNGVAYLLHHSRSYRRPPSKESESEDDGSLASVLGLFGSFSFLLFVFFRTDPSLSSGEVAPRVFIM